MAQKKASRQSNKKGSSDKVISKAKPKLKSAASTKKKVAVTTKPKTKTASPKKSAPQMANKRPVAKTKTKPKLKSAASTKKKVAVTTKSKTKTASPKKSAPQKANKRPVARVKAKPKASQPSPKSSPSKKIVKTSISSSTKKTPTAHLSTVTKSKKVPSKAKPNASPKKPIPKNTKVVATPQAKIHTKQTTKPTSSQKAQAPKKVVLSPIDRYNIGGLLACAIDQDKDPGLQKFKKALKHLALSVKEQENLVRVTQGFMFPKLFADEIKNEEVRELAVKEFVGFAKAEGHYERDWHSDLKQFAIWLGIVI